jgi:hypothetical protein
MDEHSNTINGELQNKPPSLAPKTTTTTMKTPKTRSENHKPPPISKEYEKFKTKIKNRTFFGFTTEVTLFLRDELHLEAGVDGVTEILH